MVDFPNYLLSNERSIPQKEVREEPVFHQPFNDDAIRERERIRRLQVLKEQEEQLIQLSHRRPFMPKQLPAIQTHRLANDTVDYSRIKERLQLDLDDYWLFESNQIHLQHELEQTSQEVKEWLLEHVDVDVKKMNSVHPKMVQRPSKKVAHKKGLNKSLDSIIQQEDTQQDIFEK